MAHPHLPGAQASFTSWFRTITSGLAPDRGWYSVFLRRDPQQLQAYLAGDDVPPWDVVASLLQDLAQDGGPDERVSEDARRLHHAALEEHDLGSGRQAVVAALEEALREREKARHHLTDLAGRATEAGAARQTPWVQDLHQRLAARCVELQRRLGELDHSPPELSAGPAGASTASAEPRENAPRPTRGGARSRAERMGATFASVTLGLQGVLPSPALVSGSQPPPQEQEKAEEDPVQVTADWRVVRQIAWQLALLRAGGSGGQAHVLLCEAVAGPARRLPRLACALEETGQFPEVAVLIWETASLPPVPVATAVLEFVDQGRRGDVEALLRHASARRHADIAHLAASFSAARRRPEAVLLLRHVVRTQPREFCVDLAQIDGALVPLLMQAARDVSEWHEMQLDYALRLAGMPTGSPGGW